MSCSAKTVVPWQSCANWPGYGGNRVGTQGNVQDDASRTGHLGKGHARASATNGSRTDQSDFKTSRKGQNDAGRHTSHHALAWPIAIYGMLSRSQEGSPLSVSRVR